MKGMERKARKNTSKNGSVENWPNSRPKKECTSRKAISGPQKKSPREQSGRSSGGGDPTGKKIHPKMNSVPDRDGGGETNKDGPNKL